MSGGGSWSDMLDWEEENGIQRPASVPVSRPADVVETRPAESVNERPASSPAGLAALRAGAARAGLLRSGMRVIPGKPVAVDPAGENG